MTEKDTRNCVFFLFEVTALCYDKYGRVVQTRATNHLGGYDLTYNALDFLGKPTKTLKNHNIAGQASVVELYTYDYNKAQQPTTTTYSLNGGAALTLVANGYDELGRLSTNNRHNGADAQSYAYNIRNWPTTIASGTFEENLYYNSNLPSGATANYNGNIAYSTWTYNGVNKGYSYVYDGLNRLTLANFKQGNSSQSNDSFNESFAFDKMGNIITLQRKKDNVLIDDLALHYKNGEKSNQLEWITDANGTQALSNTKEYQDVSKAASGEFAYDVNGNMTKDLDRNIVAIQYNLLNLPDIIQFKNGNQIKNTYDASGLKLGTEYFTQVTNITPLADGQIISQSYSPGTVDQTGSVYIGNVEYNTQHGNSSLTAISRIYNDEGYVEIPSNPQYYYYRRDHLGDNREVWLANTGETVQRTQYYPSGLPWASNVGDNPGKQQRKYNGKEFVEMHGYDMYDFDHRGFYPAGDFFTTRDWKAEETPDVSPYSYACDNPVRYRDENGDGAGDKIIGFLAALADNTFGGATDLRNVAAKYATNVNDFNSGQNAGDAITIVAGVLEYGGGGNMMAGGTATVVASLSAELPSGGTSTTTLAGGAVAIGAGKLMQNHGVLMMAAGAANMATQKGRVGNNDDKTHGNSTTSEKTSGNYQNTHKSGKTYNGVGNEARMNQSAKNISSKKNDPVVNQTWKSASNKKEAYIREHNAIQKNGGAGNTQRNYNQRNSPGKKILENK